MKFTKGKSGNPAGRPAGSEDKVKKDVRSAYQAIVEGNLPNIENWLNVIARENPAKALDFMLKLSEFILPKMKAAEQVEVIEKAPKSELQAAVDRINAGIDIEAGTERIKVWTENYLAQHPNNFSSVGSVL